MYLDCCCRVLLYGIAWYCCRVPSLLHVTAGKAPMQPDLNGRTACAFLSCVVFYTPGISIHVPVTTVTSVLTTLYQGSIPFGKPQGAGCHLCYSFSACCCETLVTPYHITSQGRCSWGNRTSCTLKGGRHVRCTADALDDYHLVPHMLLLCITGRGAIPARQPAAPCASVLVF
jgi:hypothetical protein